MLKGKKYLAKQLQAYRQKVIGQKRPSITGKNHPQYGKRGKQTTNWQGDIQHHVVGYILEYTPKHPLSNHQGYMCQHRLIIEKYLNRYLKKKERVHHIDSNPANNNIKNLICFKSESGHRCLHINKQINQKEIIFDGRKIKEVL